MRNKSKTGRNDSCPCNSGLKYKKCCQQTDILKEREQSEQAFGSAWAERVMNGSVFAEITTENGVSGSMTVFSASVTKNGKTTELFNDEIVLSTNSADKNSDKSENARAFFSIPQNENDLPKVITEGIAAVQNKLPPHLIRIKDNPKKGLKARSPDGILWANISVVFRRDCSFDCFDIIFGDKNKPEVIIDGKKQRPHLTIFPDGNNKFFRASNAYKCKLECDLSYISEKTLIYPIESRVILDDYSQILVLSFLFDPNSNTVELQSAEFKANSFNNPLESHAFTESSQTA